MKTQILIIGVISLFVLQSNAYSANSTLSDDTVTTGNFDDCHAAFGRAAYLLDFSSTQWLVFERRSDSSSMIAAKRILTTGTWDTTVTVISSSPITEDERLPDILSSAYQFGGRNFIHSVSAWQQRKNGVWNIYVSTQRSDTAAWDPPVSLVNDSIDCTNPHLLVSNDSSFLLLWKRGNSILCTILNLSPLQSPLSSSAPATLVLSNDDSLEFDVTMSYSSARIVWTARDSSRNRVFLFTVINNNPVSLLSPPDTLPVDGDFSNPQFVKGYNFPAFLLFEKAVNNRHEVHLWMGYEDLNLSADSTSDFRNPCAYMSLKVTGSAGKITERTLQTFLDVVTMEKNKYGDSLLVVQGDFGYSDSVKTVGFNRNACLGTLMYYEHGNKTPLVWESNRDGRSHLYSRMMVLDIGGGVKEIRNTVNNFELEQNFPNPFNPSTTIRFRLLTGANVKVKIIDLLGRTVETLVATKLNAGEYETRWDGSRYSSGVYFCRLEAGTYTATTKLILLK